MQKEIRKTENGKEGRTLMGGWLVWLFFGGLFLFLMFRGGGCCGGHGGHDGHSGGSGGSGKNRIDPHEDH
jgi:hypothetical protein